MNVLLISHTCMSRTMGQPKLHCLAAYPDLHLTVLVPDRMRAYNTWREADRPANPPFDFVVQKTRWHSIRGQWYLMHYTQGLERLLKESCPDVIDIWEEPWSLMCVQAIRAARRYCPQARLLVETEQNIYKHLPPPFQQFQDYSLRHAEFVVARNQEAVKVVRQKGFHGPTRVVPNAVDCDLFRPPDPSDRDARRKENGFPAENTFLVGYVGRLVTSKGLSDAVAALALLTEDTHLLFVGEGPAQAELEAQAQSLGLGARVHFVGSKPLQDLPYWMGMLDVLVLPSRTTPSWKEQFGRVLIEAGACGVAVVGSDSGAIPDVVADAGLIFPEGDVVAFADRLQRLKDAPAFRQQCGQIGYERARRLFSWQQVAAQMHDIYRELLPEPRRESP